MSNNDSAWRVMSRLTLAADLRRLVDDLENTVSAQGRGYPQSC